jgi:DNA polymerase-3 subunit epsilon
MTQRTATWDVFDVETTGVDIETDRIVTACAATVNTPKPVLPCQWLVNPGVEIPEASTAIHGITTEQAREHGVDPAEACAQILTALRAHWDAGDPVVAFNAVFDLTILDREVRRHGVADGIGLIGPVIDPLTLDRHADPYRRGSRRLDAVCRHYRVRLDAAHDSTQDALAAGRVAWAIFCQHPELDEMPAGELDAFQARAYRTWALRYQTYLRSQGRRDVIDRSWPIRPWKETAR